MNKMVSLAPELSGVSNRRLTLHLIREKGPISRAEIARRLHLSRPTASRIVDALEQGGLIARTGKSKPTGGRLGELYRFRDDAGFVLGLELGTREARVAIATLNGEIMSRMSRKLMLETRQIVLPQLSLLVADAISHFAERLKSPATILSIGVAVPGVVHLTPVPGYVDAAKIFLGLNDRPLRSELEHLFRVPVAMENDVNLAAIGECQFGCAQGHRNVVYLFVGRGIGAGIVSEGHLLRGSSQAAGEVGNMVIDRANLYQELGTCGCLESLASIDQLVVVSGSSGTDYESTEALCEQAFTGETQALDAIRTMNEYLAAAIINLVAVIDPEMVVLGGDLAELPHVEELFVPPIEQFIRRHVGDVPRLRLSQLQGDAALYGALQAAIDIVLNAAGKSDFNAEGMLYRATEAADVAG
jgi:predicted NBD/HSP70 family sugar kinase